MGGRAWTAEEIDKAARLWADGASIKELVAALDRGRGAITCMMHKHRHRFEKRKVKEDVAREAMLTEGARLWAAGVPSDAIADELGLSAGYMKQLVRENRDRFPKRSKPRRQPYPETVIERASGLWRRGDSALQISRTLGVPEGAIMRMAVMDRARFPRRGPATKQTAWLQRQQDVAEFQARAEELPAALQAQAMPANAEPMPFLSAIDKGRCLFSCTDATDACGPDMPVCGAPRDFTGSHFSRYCAFHAQLSIGAGTPSERSAHRSLIKMAGAEATRVTA